jgi:dishevelled associated activator of morphogenesis
MIVIDKAIQQIVIQKDSENPDPAADLANIDVNKIISSMSNDGDRLKDTEERLRKATVRYKRLEKELETIQADADNPDIEAPSNVLSTIGVNILIIN